MDYPLVVLNLPTDRTRSNVTDRSAQSFKFSFDWFQWCDKIRFIIRDAVTCAVVHADQFCVRVKPCDGSLPLVAGRHCDGRQAQYPGQIDRPFLLSKPDSEDTSVVVRSLTFPRTPFAIPDLHPPRATFTHQSQSRIQSSYIFVLL